MKFLLVSAAILLSTFCFSQQQTYYFVKNNGALALTKDSADYIRVVTEPEKGSDLFTISEFYISGSKKSLFKSLSSYPVFIEGTRVSYFPNGRRKATENYKGGQIVGNAYEFYPNRKLYIHKEYAEVPAGKINTNEYAIQMVNDSLGNALVENGTGNYKIYDTDFKDVVEEGPLKNGKRDGSWKGSNKETASTFKEEYSNGRLISGTAVYNGANYNYTNKRYTGAMFPGGDAAFGRFLVRQIRYPAYEREKSIQGKVIVSFEVEKDGTLNNLQVVQSISKGLDQEALHVIKSSPKWTSGTLYGVPQKVTHTVSISFALGGM